MHTKIYFGSKALYLAQRINEELEILMNDKGTVVSSEVNQQAIKIMIDKMQEPGVNSGLLIHNNTEELLSWVKKEFEVIQAGGGLVYVENEKEILLIFRRGKWDLPKGKLDPGEKIDECALREVEEETGLQNLYLKQLLCTTYHTYYQNSNFILKESFWFLMTTPREQVLTPQLEEDIEKCEWVQFSKISPYLDNSFPAIVDVIQSASRIVNKKSS
jgi:8-oxo-dGTP pyrophosphatase MutT (NUDIX family)